MGINSNSNYLNAALNESRRTFHKRQVKEEGRPSKNGIVSRKSRRLGTS